MLQMRDAAKSCCRGRDQCVDAAGPSVYRKLRWFEWGCSVTTPDHDRDGTGLGHDLEPNPAAAAELARRRAIELASQLAITGPLFAVLLDPTRADAYSNGSGSEGDLDP